MVVLISSITLFVGFFLGAALGMLENKDPDSKELL